MKYFNDALIGNDKIVASFSKKGELLRMYYPTRDFRQFIDDFFCGVKINDSKFIYFHDDINNQYNQYYTEDTNILNTLIYNTYFKLKVHQTNFVCIDKNVMIYRYSFENKNDIDLYVKFGIYSKLLSSLNNVVGGRIDDNVFMQYSHNYTVSIFSESNIYGHKMNNSKVDINNGEVSDYDHIGMSPDSALSYDIGKIAPGEKREFSFFIYISDNIKHPRFEHSKDYAEEIRKNNNVEIEERKTEDYWKDFIKKHDGLGIYTDKARNKFDNYELIKKIYTRTILLFPLISNSETGAVTAALEVDEKKDKCGRYSYCWPRDAVFETLALDRIGFSSEVTKFYKEFIKRTQSNVGYWEQRFYSDGMVAPCWGYQIDETAAVVYGIYRHYKELKNQASEDDNLPVDFLNDMYDTATSAVEFLKGYIRTISDVEENPIEPYKDEESYDLWENYRGVHLYSIAGVYAALDKFGKMTKILYPNKDEEVTELNRYKKLLKAYVDLRLKDEDRNIFKRNNKDDRIDISVLGAAVPFEMYDVDDETMKNTVKLIDEKLWINNNGYLRYTDDNYMGGQNIWPIASFWRAMYYSKKGELGNLKMLFDKTITSATEHGFLAEQVNSETMEPIWVIGLGWSHAMFILALYYMMK